MPSTVVMRAQCHRQEGSRPTVRSVPGPSKRTESRRISSSLRATAVSRSIRCSHAATGSSSSIRQTCATSCHSRSSASARGSSGWTSSAHASVGQGAAVQFVVRWLTISIDSRSCGSRSLPSTAGSTPSMMWGATGPVSAISAHAVLAERAHPLSVPGGHEPERLGSGVQRADALEMDVEHVQVDELGAGLVGGLRDRARERLLPGLGAEAHDLTGLDVRAEADDQLGERVDLVGGAGTHDS